MALSKIQSESLNLADNFAFTGTVSGAGEITASSTVPASSSSSVNVNLTNAVAKTWVRYDLRTGPTLESSLNITSATDDGTGTFSFNLTNNLSSENGASLSGTHTYDENPTQAFSAGSIEIGTESTSELEGYVGYSGTKYDCAQIFGQQFGDLA